MFEEEQAELAVLLEMAGNIRRFYYDDTDIIQDDFDYAGLMLEN